MKSSLFKQRTKQDLESQDNKETTNPKENTNPNTIKKINNPK